MNNIKLEKNYRNRNNRNRKKRRQKINRKNLIPSHNQLKGKKKGNSKKDKKPNRKNLLRLKKTKRLETRNNRKKITIPSQNSSKKMKLPRILLMGKKIMECRILINCKFNLKTKNLPNTDQNKPDYPQWVLSRHLRRDLNVNSLIL